MSGILFKPNFAAGLDDLKTLPLHSHRRKLSWQWLNAIIPPDGETGEVVRKMAERRDMKMDKLANRRQLFNYLVESKIPLPVAARVQYPMWESWVEYLKARTAVGEEAPLALNLSPKGFKKAGISRKQLALVVLRAFQFHGQNRDNVGQTPEAMLEGGGPWAAAAYDTAADVIELVERHLTNRSAPSRKPGNDGTSENPWADYED